MNIQEIHDICLMDLEQFKSKFTKFSMEDKLEFYKEFMRDFYWYADLSLNQVTRKHQFMTINMFESIIERL